MSRQSELFTVAVLVVVVIVLSGTCDQRHQTPCVLGLGSAPPAREEPPVSQASRENHAIAAAQQMVRMTLVSPESASFGASEVLAQDGGAFLVSVQVDASNGFGALLRGTFFASLELDPDDPRRFSYDAHDGKPALTALARVGGIDGASPEFAEGLLGWKDGLTVETRNRIAEEEQRAHRVERARRNAEIERQVMDARERGEKPTR